MRITIGLALCIHHYEILGSKLGQELWEGADEAIFSSSSSLTFD
jgi:hypothetical protein